MKPWYRSLTIRSGIVTIVVSVAAILNICLSLEDAEALVELGMAIAAAISGIITIVGRCRANTQIGEHK